MVFSGSFTSDLGIKPGSLMEILGLGGEVLPVEHGSFFSVHLQFSRLCLISYFIILKTEHFVVTGRTKGIIGNLFCACHPVSYC